MIYFIRSGGPRGLVKIGYAKDVRTRLDALQIGSAQPLTLIGVADGEIADERAWHRRFSNLRVRGEWFRFTKELKRAARPHLRETMERKGAQLNREYDELRELLASRGAGQAPL